MAQVEQIEVSAVYALPEEQLFVTMHVALGTTVEQLVASCVASRKFPPLADPRFAIFGRLAEPTQKLRAGDRVEILRPLNVDPKEARRRSVAAAQSEKRTKK